MKPLIALALLLLTPPGTPSGGFRWQRIVTPPQGAPLAQACVVLDADTFANAAPALRDLRLFQDGSELPYVVEESFDEQALLSGVTRADDRSLYETVASTTLLPVREPSPAPGVRGRFHWSGQVRLAAHVPVERLRLESPNNGPTDLQIVASVPVEPLQPAETVDITLAADQPSWPLTLGANLQRAMLVDITESQSSPSQGSSEPQRVLLQMRRRSLCYQPRTASPLTLYLGGGGGMAAKTYSFANSFSPAAVRPFATMGPLIPNPEEQAGNQPRWNRRLWLSTGALLLMLLFARVSFALVHRSERKR